MLLKIAVSVLHLLFGLGLLARLCGANPYNPFLHQILRFTEPVLRPLRTLLPPILRLDTASLAVMVLISMFALLVQSTLDFSSWHLPTLALLQVLRALLNLMLIALMLRVLKSWFVAINRHPASEIIDALSAPLLVPFRNFLRMGPLDFSPLFALFLLLMIRGYIDYAAGYILQLPATT